MNQFHPIQNQNIIYVSSSMAESRTCKITRTDTVPADSLADST